jgi:hypothetical protein
MARFKQEERIMSVMMAAASLVEWVDAAEDERPGDADVSDWLFACSGCGYARIQAAMPCMTMTDRPHGRTSVAVAACRRLS